MKLTLSKRIYSSYRLFTLLVIVALLGACGSTYQAPISERRQPPTHKIFQHVVSSGETLFSIAWRYDLDYKKLAQVNNLGADFTIYPGEVLDLRTDSSNSYDRNRQRYHIAKTPSKVSSVNRSSNSPTVNNSIATNTNPNTNRSRPAVTSVEKKTSVVRPSYATSSNRRVVWRWPLKGAVISKFSGAQGLNKGIDIKAKAGEKVTAAAAGTVVYAGSGLRGYGKLLIIRHNNTFLSAYGHNSRLRVKEGDTVAAGGYIADAGASGTDISKLHFEIRRDGKPVNPLNYLPKNTRQ